MQFNGLKLDSSGELVALLHKLLSFLSYDIDKSEIRAKLFGVSTEIAIRKFQKGNNLEVTGEIKLKTAAVLEVVFRIYLSLDGKPRKFKFTGRVVDRKKKPIKNVLVELWFLEKENVGKVIEASRKTKANGKFSFTVSSKDISKATRSFPTRFFFKVKDDELPWLDTVNTHYWDTESETIPSFEIVYHPVDEWIIKGKIFGKNLSTKANLLVLTWDKKNDIALGKAFSNEEGAYQISFSRANFPKRFPDDYLPSPYLNVYESNQLLKTTYKNPVRNALPNTYEKDLHIEMETISHEQFISGQIRLEGGEGVSGVTVLAYNHTINGPLKIGSTSTDEQGHYHLKLEVPGQANSADLQLKILDEEDNEISATEIYYNVEKEKNIDISIAENLLPRTSEYSKITSDLRTQIGDRPFKDLKVEGERNDFTLLSHKTNWSEEQIKRLSLADSYATETEVPAPFFFSMLKSDSDTSLDEIFQISDQNLKKNWDEAVNNNIIDADIAGTFSDVFEVFKAKRTAHLLDSSGPSTSRVANMVQLSSISEEQKKKLIDLYFDDSLNTGATWEAVEQDFGKDARSELELLNQVSFLAFDNQNLVSTILKKSLVKKHPSELLHQNYYDAVEWVILLEDEEVEIEAEEADRVKALEEFAEILSDRLILTYPTAALHAQIKNGRIPLVDDEAKPEVLKFFTEHELKFQIDKVPVEKYLKEIDGRLIAKALEEVKGLQRVYHISPSFTVTRCLLEKGINSSRSIVNYGEAQFLEDFSVDLGETNAKYVYSKALQIHSTVFNTAIQYITSRNNPNIYSIAKPEHKDVPAEILAYPTLEQLFGEMDFCACQHCKSVLSPAAYLVDLLNFIDVKPSSSELEKGKRNPLAVLLDRRPDIQYLQLTCENTNTILPYIDVVNEILEFFISNAHQASNITHPDYSPLDGFEGYNVDEQDASENLIANPQFIREATYDILKSKVFPFSMPYNYPLALLRKYLDIIEIPLFRILEILGISHKERALYERLGMSSEEYQIYTAKKKAIAEYFGTAGDAAGLNDHFHINGTFAKDFARKVDLSYEELQTLIRTYFINPHQELIPKLEKLYLSIGQIVGYLNEQISEVDFEQLLTQAGIKGDDQKDTKEFLETSKKEIEGLILLVNASQQGDECNFTELVLQQANNSPLEEWHYIKIIRFIRLRKKLGLTIQETDLIISVLNPGLSRVEGVEELNNGFQLLIQQIAQLKKIIEVLGLEFGNDHQQLLQVLSSGENQIRKEQLCRLMRISTLELQLFINMSGLDPFKQESTVPLTTLEFVEQFQRFQSLGIDLQKLSFYLRHEDLSGNAAPSTDSLTLLAKRLKIELQQVELEFDLGATPSLEDIRGKIMMVYNERSVDDFFQLITNSRIFVASYDHYQEELEASLLTGDIPLRYNDFRKELSCLGFLGKPKFSFFKETVSSLSLEEEKEKKLIKAIANLYLQAHEEEERFFAIHPELKETYQKYRQTENTNDLYQGLVSDLKTLAKKRSIYQYVASLLEIDISNVEAILGNPSVFQSIKGQHIPVIQDILDLEEKAVKVIYHSAVLGESADFAFKPNVYFIEENRIVEQIDFVFTLRPDESGFVNFLVETSSNAQVELTINDRKINGDMEGLGWRNSDSIELNHEREYRFILSVKRFTGEIRLKWQGERSNEPFKQISNHQIFATEHLEGFKSSYLGFLKGISLFEDFALTDAEIRYFIGELKIEEKGIFDMLPVEFNRSDEDLAHALFQATNKIVSYCLLKNELDASDLSFIEVVKELASAATDSDHLLFKMNNWDKVIIDELLTHFQFRYEDLRDFEKMRRIKEVYTLVLRVGIPFEELKLMLESEPSIANADILKKSLAAKYSPMAWDNLAEELNNSLRNERRNALVDAALELFAKNEKTKSIDTPNKLFEYFLVDTEMDACMKITRVKQAISSVQLFIQRCILNLEQKVATTHIRKGEWNWMKRYRVWEANRKVFLYPENWLDPELRSDKSPLYKELESQILQSNLNAEIIYSLYTDYLSKLRYVAKLEICSTVIESPGHGAEKIDFLSPSFRDDILHVFAKNESNLDEFYYRRSEAGYWTPWEIVDLDIEDTPIRLVIWDGRLFVFWLNIHLASENAEHNGETSSNINLNIDINSDPAEVTTKFSSASASNYLDVAISWSEYVNGQWLSRKKSNSQRLKVIGEFERSRIRISAPDFVRSRSEGLDATGDTKLLFTVILHKTSDGSWDVEGRFYLFFHNKYDAPTIFEEYTMEISKSTFLVDGPAFSTANASGYYFNRYLRVDNGNVDFTTYYRSHSIWSSPIISNEAKKVSLAGRLPIERHELNRGGFGFLNIIRINNLYTIPAEKAFTSPFFIQYLEYNFLVKPQIVGTPSITSDGTIIWPALGEEFLAVLKYTFKNHFHPYVDFMMNRIKEHGITGLISNETQSKEEDFFESFFDPVSSSYFTIDSEPKKIDLSENGAYSVYNWELFFHIPIGIALQLSKNQRFQEAQNWFHYIFDPTTTDESVEGPVKFWRFKAFKEIKAPQQIDELLKLLSSGEETEEREHILARMNAWRKNPFQPHVIARTRFIAYQYYLVMKYLDNLIEWGDSLFRQDSMESINEATQLYVLAANILGPKPQKLPRHGKSKPQSFASLREKLDDFGNALVDLESHFPFNRTSPFSAQGDHDGARSLFGISQSLYFCIPQNDKLLGYWDIVADRLFKVRHCMNIEGIVRQLPIFQPPIDPGMLVKATAAGIDINSLVSGQGQPNSPVRATLLIQKAFEICTEVKSLGNTFLSVLEKRDSESLGLLRQRHEMQIMELAKDGNYLQWKEAEANTDALLQSRESVYQRYLHYQQLLGKKRADISHLELLALERRKLIEGKTTKEKEKSFEEIYKVLVEQYTAGIELEAYPPNDHKADGKLHLNYHEDLELNLHMPRAQRKRQDATDKDQLYGKLGLLPNLGVDFQFWGVGGHLEFGGPTLAAVGRILAGKDRAEADKEGYKGGRLGKVSSYQRRVEDWILQSNLAAKELLQIGRQIIASLIREQIAKKEYDNQQVRIKHAHEINTFLEHKFTNKDLYGWLQGELSKLYYDSYKFAYDIAKRAEQTMKKEIMRPELDSQSFIKLNHWDTGRKGLLAGESLHLDLKRMELAYHEYNKREYELTKHISLKQLNAFALLQLKTTGYCTFDIPEWLYDLDCPGHYMRRIKSVGLSIPAIVGPYTSVNCTLSLQKSSIRTVATQGDAYGRQEEDSRFVDYLGTIQSVVTSSAQNDNGLFEVNLRDERFLPFENAGAISTWRLELPNHLRQFNYNHISDVIIHIRYTARQGGAILGNGATDFIKDSIISNANKSGFRLMFNLKHDFPNEWNQFQQGEANFKARISRNHFPYLSQVGRIELEGDHLPIAFELWTQESEKLKPLPINPAAIKEGPLQGDETEIIGHTLSNLNENTPQAIIEISRSILQEDNRDYYLLINYKVNVLDW